MKNRYWLSAVLLLLLHGRGMAAPAPVTAEMAVFTSALLQAPVVKQHQGSFAGKSLHYRSVVEAFSVEPLAGNPLTLVSTSYLVGDDAQRPVLFAFNGGPISPAIYLHMLALAPQRLAVAADLNADPASFPRVDNHYAPLDRADIVLFDPAGTGFSTFAKPELASQYFGNQADAKAFVAFAHAWLARHGREHSPVYLLGESYGTMRAAAVAELLSEEATRLDLRGIYLFGQALNIVETAQRPDNILTYVVSLQTLAALGWYHGKVAKEGRTLPQFLGQVQAFAEGPYLQILLAGNRASEQQKQQVAQQLARFTGVSADIQLQYQLRMSKNQFRQELLKDSQRVLGASDGRYTAVAAKEGELPDASASLYPALFAAFAQYQQQFLGLKNPPKYVTDSPVAGLADWDWGSKVGPFGNWPYAQGISKALATFPQMQLMVGVGYFDTLTTTGATEYLLQQQRWPAQRISLKYYQGGHMAYTVEQNLASFSDDLRQLLRPNTSK